MLFAALAVIWVCAAASDGNDAIDLGVDDECHTAGNGSECAFNALQRRGSKMTLSESEKSAGSDPGAHYRPTLARHFGEDCWRHCSHRGGYCGWCGPYGACCRYGSRKDPGECHNVRRWVSFSFHTCVVPHVAGRHGPEGEQTTTPSAASSDSSSSVDRSIKGMYYHPANSALAAPSDAPLLTFYMYRVMSDSNYTPENVNTANLAGIMWYLHNEVVILTPRKFDATRIVRLRVQTKAPAPLYQAGMNFGVRYAFDSGKCTGPWICNKQFSRYGYFVGCNYVNDFPTLKWAKTNFYQNAIWYSLPGPCSDKYYNEHDNYCMATAPGGSCTGSPTGRGNCTYTTVQDGEIRIDELEGIQDYKLFTKLGGREYVEWWDKGIGMNFWNGKNNTKYNAMRVQAAEKLFDRKFGRRPNLQEPKCDFWQHGFYKNSPPE